LSRIKDGKQEIHIDPPLLEQKFQEKAWTKPINFGTEEKPDMATPLAEDAFKTYKEFENFVINHEREHKKYSRDQYFKETQDNSRGGYEDAINNRILPETLPTEQPGEAFSLGSKKDDAARNVNEFLASNDRIINNVVGYDESVSVRGIHSSNKKLENITGQRFVIGEDAGSFGSKSAYFWLKSNNFWAGKYKHLVELKNAKVLDLRKLNNDVKEVEKIIPKYVLDFLKGTHKISVMNSRLQLDRTLMKESLVPILVGKGIKKFVVYSRPKNASNRVNSVLDNSVIISTGNTRDEAIANVNLKYIKSNNLQLILDTFLNLIFLSMRIKPDVLLMTSRIIILLLILISNIYIWLSSFVDKLFVKVFVKVLPVLYE